MTAAPLKRQGEERRWTTEDGYEVEIWPASPAERCVCMVTGPGIATSRLGLPGWRTALTWAQLAISDARLEQQLKGAPPSGRWSAKVKERIVLDIAEGRQTVAEAVQAYNLSKLELEGWRRSYREYGLDGLKTLRLQELRR